jgi:anti-sigma-K factor RskA
MNAMQHIEQDDLALFAMELLTAEEMAAIKLHLEHCEACRTELAAVMADLAVYAHTVDLHSPPALTRERLMKQVAREKKIVPIDRTAERIAETAGVGERVAPQYQTQQYQTQEEPVFRNSSYLDYEDEPQRSFASKALPWAGWAVAAGLAVAAGQLYHERDALRTTIASESGQLARVTADAAAARQVLDTMNDPSAMRVTLNKAQTAPVPQGRVTYVPDKGSLIFLASNLEPLQPYKVYELWLIPADGRDPIPAGTFKPDDHGNANVIMPQLPKGVDAKAFGVTVEDAGGSQTPTQPIILAGA